MMRVAVAALVLALTACGSSIKEPEPTEPAPGGGEPGKFADVAPVVARSCGRCHNAGQAPKINSEASFKTTKNLQLIESGRMPPGGGLPAADKATLVRFLRG